MNSVVLTGRLEPIRRYDEQSQSYEGIMSFTQVTLRSANVLTRHCKVGVWVPKIVLDEVADGFTFTDLQEFDGEITVEGKLVASEVARGVKTSSIVVTKIILNQSSNRYNQVRISGVVSGIVRMSTGANYTLKNPRDVLKCRVITNSADGLRNGSKVSIYSGELISYDYKHHKTGEVYSVCGVQDTSTTVK